MLWHETFAGVVLFPEASLPLRVIQPRIAEAIDKAVNHVDAPCMIGVVSATPRSYDASCYFRIYN